VTRRTDQKGARWFAVGLERAKLPVNLGSTFRSAVAFGAQYVFTVGARYPGHCSDTVRSWRHVPYFHWADLEDLQEHRPYDVPLVGVEIVPRARPLETYVHPRRALYLLGPEDGGLSREAQELCGDVVQITTTEYCLNVAQAATVVLYDRRAKEL